MQNILRSKFFLLLLILCLSSCSLKQNVSASSATILIKTPSLKFYDKGFITKFKNYTQVQIFQAGKTVLNLEIYKNRVCESTFKCKDLKTFNKEFLSSSYKKNFLKDLFDSEDKTVIFRDRVNGILIKIIRD